MDAAVMAWIIIGFTDSPFLVALTFVARMAPMAFAGPFAGILADRMNRATVMRIARTVMIINYLAMATLLATDVLVLWHLYAVILIGGTAWTFDMAARRAMTPDLVDSPLLANAIALDVMVFTFSLMLGPIVAGAVLPFVSSAGIFAMLALFVATSLFIIQGVDSEVEPTRRPTSNFLALLTDGFAFVRAHPPVAGALLVAAASEGFAFSFIPLVPIFATDILDVSATKLGILFSAEGFGAIAASLAVAVLSQRTSNFGRLMLFGSGGAMLTGFALAFSPWYGLTFVLLIVLGAMGSLFFMMQSNLIFGITPKESRGRIVGIQMLVIGMFPLGSLLVGILASVLTPQIAVAIMSAIGVAMLAATTIAFPVLWKSLSRD
jgi:MFS family permease